MLGIDRRCGATEEKRAEHRPQPKAHLDCRESEQPRPTKEEETRSARFEILWQRSRKGGGAFSGFWTREEEVEYFDLIGLKPLPRETETIAV